MLKLRDKIYSALIAGILCIIILFSAAIIFNVNIFEHNPYDSYTRQALAWREGRTYLNDDPESLSYLELAIYEDKYYVSFPPVPTFVELVLSFFFGQNTPNQFMLYMYTIISCMALTLLFNKKHNVYLSVILGLTATLGSNLPSLVAFGGVWHEAQCLSFMLCSLAVLFITSNKKVLQGLSLFFAALAVGCRPFTVIFIPFLLYVLYKKNANNESGEPEKLGLIKSLRLFVPYLIAPAMVALLLMIYNIMRFGNPLEFGHNYLPEFLREENGQFHLSYILDNLIQAIKLPFEFIPEFKLSIDTFSANIFYVFNPIIAVFLYFNMRSVFNDVNLWDITWIFAVITFILVTCMHKTLGGFQFGARYFIDFIPYISFYIAYKNINAKRGSVVLTFVCLFGVALNIYGITTVI